jgi:hypothetical protein
MWIRYRNWNDFGFLEYAMLNKESFPKFLQTVQLPSSELMSLGTSKIIAKDVTSDNNHKVRWNWKTFHVLHGKSQKLSQVNANHEKLSTREIQIFILTFMLHTCETQKPRFVWMEPVQET